MDKSIVGVILAGGKGLRMGGCDKVLLEIAGKTILNHIIENASAQLPQLFLNTNSEPNLFSHCHLKIIKDQSENSSSPLLGIYSTLEWLKENHIECNWLMTFPGDCPFFPDDIVWRLMGLLEKLPEAKICSVIHNQQIQPLFSLWSSDIIDSLKEYIEVNKFSVQGFINSFPHAVLELSDDDFNESRSENKVSGWEKFFININTADELQKARS